MAEAVPKISGLLRRALGHDFGEYKQNTVVRRIQRRMQVLQFDDPPTISSICATLRPSSTRCFANFSST
jgi:chemotaxis methyl-accepting protein methylase